MLERCRKELRKLARSATPAGARARQLLEQLPEARISTFHSFCQSVLRFYPVEAALDPEFRVADDMEAGTLLAAAVDETLTAAAASADEPVVDLLARFGRSRLAEHLQRLISQMRNLGESPASLRQATLAAAARLGPRDGLTLPVRLAVADLLAYQTKPGSKGREQQEQLAQTWARLDPLLADGLAGEGALVLVAELRTMAGAINGNSLKPKPPLVEAVNAVEAALWTAEEARVGLAVLDLMERALGCYQARKDAANLLDFAERHGVAVDSGCRPGRPTPACGRSDRSGFRPAPTPPSRFPWERPGA
jgi:ATP-dependent helicase/nuclease subunit A